MLAAFLIFALFDNVLLRLLFMVFGRCLVIVGGCLLFFVDVEYSGSCLHARFVCSAVQVDSYI